MGSLCLGPRRPVPAAWEVVAAPESLSASILLREGDALGVCKHLRKSWVMEELGGKVSGSKPGTSIALLL